MVANEVLISFATIEVKKMRCRFRTTKWNANSAFHLNDSCHGYERAVRPVRRFSIQGYVI